jgi:hypothetical protein
VPKPAQASKSSKKVATLKVRKQAAWSL